MAATDYEGYCRPCRTAGQTEDYRMNIWNDLEWWCVVVWTLYKRAIKRCGILLISLGVVTVNFITRYSAHYVNLFSTAYTFKLCHYKYSDFAVNICPSPCLSFSFFNHKNTNTENDWLFFKCEERDSEGLWFPSMCTLLLFKLGLFLQTPWDKLLSVSA